MERKECDLIAYGFGITFPNGQSHECGGNIANYPNFNDFFKTVIELFIEREGMGDFIKYGNYEITLFTLDKYNYDIHGNAIHIANVEKYKIGKGTQFMGINKGAIKAFNEVNGGKVY